METDNCCMQEDDNIVELEDNMEELKCTTAEESGEYKSLSELTGGNELLTETTEQVAPQLQPLPKHNPNDNLDLNKAGERILEHYNGRFKDVRFTTPAQVVDGCVVKFADKDLNVTLATARLRFHNQLNIDQPTGNLFVIASLSDLTFGKPHIDMRLR
jgi:hypothetical protein